MSANAYLIHAVTFVRNVALLLREKNVVMAGGQCRAARCGAGRSRNTSHRAACPETHRARLGAEVAGETAVAYNAPGTRRGARFQKLRRARGGRCCVVPGVSSAALTTRSSSSRATPR